MIDVLVLTGAPGSGKSSVLQALAGVLEEDRVQHAAIESEQLAWGHPWLPEHECYAVLGEVCRALRRFGRRLFLISATTETDEQIRQLLEAIAPDRHVVVCLQAEPETAARRVFEREPAEWLGRDALVDAARRLATQIPALAGIDVHVSSEGREPRDVARDVRRALPGRP